MGNPFSFLFPKHFGKKIMTASIFVLLILTFSPAMLIHYSSIFLALGFGIFYFMMHEDYHEHTIDMWLACFLLISFILSVSDGFIQVFNFILIYVACLAVIQSLRALTAQEISEPIKEIIETQDNSDTESLKPYGWLPSFGISVLLTLFLSYILHNQYIPVLTEAGYGFDMFMRIILPNDYTHIILFITTLLIIWFYLVKRNNKKIEKEGKELAYGFGDGDGYIFAAFITLLGIKSFLLILFCNMIILLLLGLPDYLKKRNIRCI